MNTRISPAWVVTPLLFSASLAYAAPGVDDRITAAANYTSLTGGFTGGGAALGWLHNFNTDVLMGVGADYQTLADSHWTFGTLSFAYGLNEAERRTNLYIEGHEGAGSFTNGKDFDYSVVAGGIVQNVTKRLSFQLEDKQIDIDTAHGNLGKLGVQMLWSLKLLSALSYSHSMNGNLGTRLGTLRVDYFGNGLNFIVGGAGGQGSAAVFDIQTGQQIPGLSLREGFFGVTKLIGNSDVTLLGDYIKLGQSERITLTLSTTIHLRGRR